MPVLKQNDLFAGRYLLDQLLGEGGFSEVWRALDLMADQAIVALKIYAPQQGLDEWGLRQFKNEFFLTHNLSHPHLLKVNHFDVADGSPYLIMTYCPYGSLADEVRKGGPYSERQLARVMSQIGSALEEIHRQQPSIIHQDIKPDNILLLQPDMYLLADFGISSRIRTTLTHTVVSPQAITVAYAPPERFDRQPAATAASDIFSLGVTLYEMCTTTVPWEGAGGQCLLKGARIPALPPAYSPALSALLEACMSADPAQRPTATHIRQMGTHYLETGHWPGTESKKRALPLNKGLVSALATATVALVATAGVAFYELEPATSTPTPAEESSPASAAGQSIPLESPASASNSPAVKPAAEPLPKQKAPSRQPNPKQPRQQALTSSPASRPESRMAEKPLKKPRQVGDNPIDLEPMEPRLATPTRQTSTATAPPPAKKPTATASPKASNSSTTAAKRPSTSNTTISKKKKPLFQLRPKSNSAPKKNPHHKRVKKLKRRFS